MGAVTSAMLRSATERGAEIRTGAGVSSIRAGRTMPRSPGTTDSGSTPCGHGTCWPTSRPGCCGSCSATRSARDLKPAGSQLKINFLLSRLPRLKSGHDPEEAFAGTFHVAEEYSALERSYREASGGSIPTAPPGEFYCHSLTDPSILGDLAGAGRAHAHLLRPAHAGGAVRHRPGRRSATRPYDARSPRSTYTLQSR